MKSFGQKARRLGVSGKIDPMIIVKLYGGLGNQMFQYAAAKSVAVRLSTTIFYDDEYFVSPEKFGSCWTYQLNLLNTQVEVHSSFYSKKIIFLKHRMYRKLNSMNFKFKNYFFEKPDQFDAGIEKTINNTWLDGYFQSEKYFKHIRQEILNDFSPRQRLDSKNQDIVKNMNIENSVSLHVRRGDYVSNSAAALVHATNHQNYYIQSVSHIENTIVDPVFYIFSDDIIWAQQNIKTKSKMIFIDHNLNAESYKDLFLMSQCKHNIIANSSFSWWGAWLNQNSSKIVIAPKRWYVDATKSTQDIYPEDWLKF